MTITECMSEDDEKLELFDWVEENWRKDFYYQPTRENAEPIDLAVISILNDHAYQMLYNNAPVESFASVVRSVRNAEAIRQQSYVDAWCSAYEIAPVGPVPGDFHP